MEIRDSIARLVERQSLTAEEAEAVMGQIMRGEATPAQIGGFLVALRMKGETVEEITGFARAMRNHALRVRASRVPLVDTCGTGGDRSGTFNISTVTAFVVAGAGLPVAKHGNRSVSSHCGSADVLEALGIRLDLGPEEVARCINEVGVGFLFAPRFHPAMKHALGPRREMGIRTVFNILGPLANPAGAQVQVLGVYDASLTGMVATVLEALGCQAAFVVHGTGGLDELTITGPNVVAQVQNGSVRTFVLDPLEDLGLPRAPLSSLRGGTADENAAIVRSVLQGERGPRRDVVLLNAAAALVAGGLAADMREGLLLAARSIDSGAALEKLESLIAFTRQVENAA